MDASLKPRARTTGLVIRNFEDEILVYDLESDNAHCLNKTAAAVWQMCDGQNSIVDIVHQCERELGSGVPEAFVELAVSQLAENALLENPWAFFGSISRREMVKRVGVSTVLAVPIIASIATPIHGQGTFTSCTCGNPGNCIAQTSCPSQTNCNSAHMCAP